MEVKVEQHHIDNGTPRKPFECPIALALKDATGKSWHITPDQATELEPEWAGMTFARKTFRLPRAVAKWMIGFDTRGTATPITLRINKVSITLAKPKVS